MASSFSLSLSLFLCPLLVSAITMYDKRICIDKNTGNDTSLCLQANSDHCCATLDFVLNETVNTTVSPYSNDTSISLYINSSGNHTLENSYSIQHMKGFAIIAANDTVNVICSNAGAGLSFIYSSNIIIKGITMYKCGAPQNSTSRNVFNNSEYLNYTVAVYILYCTNVRIINVTMDHSIGTSLTLYSVNGTVVIRNSMFRYSGWDMVEDYHGHGGGGGVQIEFTYCRPSIDIEDCHTTPKSMNSYSRYYISDNTFHHNRAFKGFSQLYKSKNLERESFNFGKGGGLSIIFKGDSKYNKIFVSDCHFEGNKAHYGGGLFVGYYDTVHYNNVSFNNVTLVRNTNCYILEEGSTKWDGDESGGGAKFQFSLKFELENINIGYFLGHNIINVINSTIADNTGISGGGVYISTTVGVASKINVINFLDTHFSNNSAFLGSALYLSQRFLSVIFYAKQIVIHLIDCNFESNKPICQYAGVSNATLPCTGVIYSNNFDLHFSGNVSFIDNNESSIELHSADCMVKENSIITFINNTATNYGAGIALYECSYLTVSQNTQFIFEGNSAWTQGGAMYSGLCNGDGPASLETSECFVRHYERTRHPNDWNSLFTFTNNRPSALYITSMSPCWWPEKGSLIVTENDKNNTFCPPEWAEWMYYCDDDDSISCINGSSTCDSQIKSGVASMSFEHQSINIYSGQEMPFPIMTNGRSKPITDEKLSLIYCVSSSINGHTAFYQNQSCVTVKGKTKSLRLMGNSTSHIQITTPDGLSSTLVVDFISCEWPYQFNNITRTCTVPSQYFGCYHDECTIDDIIFVNNNYCVTKDSEGDLTVASCPLSYIDTPWGGKFSSLYENCSATLGTCTCVSSVYCNRSDSALCSKCSDGFSVPINSMQLECLECSVGSGWAWFLLLQVLPLTLMVAMVILFNITLTKGPMHGFVFYCQMVSISYPGWFYPAWFSKSDLYIFPNDVYGDAAITLTVLTNSIRATFPTSLWNLNFMTLLPASITPICPFKFSSSLPAIAFWYLIALYPLFLISLIIIWVYMYTKGNKLVRCITVPLHQRIARFWRMFGIEPSMTHSICSIYLLCFTQLALTSFKLLKYTTRQSLVYQNKSSIVSYYDASLEYFDSVHIFYGTLALFVILTLVLSPALFLILYPFNWFHKFLTCFNLKKHLWINHLVDSFSGSFKNRDDTHLLGYRYFPGLYLLLRLLLIGYYFLPVQEYKLLLYFEAATCYIAAGFVMILRPYKMNRYNFIDFLIFVYLGTLAIVPVITISSSSGNNTHKLLTPLLVLINLPVAICCIYVLIVVVKMFGHCCKYCKEGYRPRRWRATVRHVEIEEEHDSTTAASLGTDYNTDTDTDEFPDRVLNPDDYSRSQTYEEHVTRTDNFHTAQEGNTSTGNSSTGNSNSNSNYSSRRLTSRASTRVRPSTGYGSIQ